jgi:hypothetical protein
VIGNKIRKIKSVIKDLMENESANADNEKWVVVVEQVDETFLDEPHVSRERRREEMEESRRWWECVCQKKKKKKKKTETNR